MFFHSFKVCRFTIIAIVHCVRALYCAHSVPIGLSSRYVHSAGILQTASTVKRKVKKPPRIMVGPQPIQPAMAATYTWPKELAQFAAREWPERARPLQQQ